MTVRYGFMEIPNLRQAFEVAKEHDLDVDLSKATVYVGRDDVLPGGRRLARWRARLFAFLARNSPSTTDSFEIPPARVVVMGERVEL